MRFPALVTATAAVVALAASPSVLAAGKTTTVTLKGLEFVKKKVTIKKGDSVKWVWADGTTPHDVTPKGSPKFKKSATKSSGKHVVRFAKAGTYSYVCTIHLNMTGKVVVR